MTINFIRNTVSIKHKDIEKCIDSVSVINYFQHGGNISIGKIQYIKEDTGAYKLHSHNIHGFK